MFMSLPQIAQVKKIVNKNKAAAASSSSSDEKDKETKLQPLQPTDFVSTFLQELKGGMTGA